MTGRLKYALAGLAACALLPEAARAHWEILWDDTAPRLSRTGTARVDLLARRAVAAWRALPAESGPRAAFQLAAMLGKIGQCRRAGALLRASRVEVEWLIFSLVQSTLRFPDRACAGRMVAFLADGDRRVGGGRTVADLYLAGALWRRLGDEARGQAAIAAAEQAFDAHERSPAGRSDWACHGGDCLSPAWNARLYALRVYHGTALHGPALSAAAERALAERAEAALPMTWREREDGAFRRMIGARVFEELLHVAVTEGADDVARLIAVRDPGQAGRELARARMRFLFNERRFAEALPLAREAGTFQWWAVDRAVMVAPADFHPHRAQFRDWTDQWPALLLELARTHMKRGDPARAREALQTLRAQVEPGSLAASSLQPAAGIEALLDSPADPLAALDRRPWPSPPFGRADAYGELALHLAYAGRWAEFDRAVAAIGPGTPADLLQRLPCIATRSGGASVRAAMERARATFLASDSESERGSRISDAVYCLLERGHADAAIAIAGWDPDVPRRLRMLASYSNDATYPGGARVQRRLADLVLAQVEAGNLGEDEDVLGFLASTYERIGDTGKVERILRRARSPADRFELWLNILDGYDPPSPMLDRIYGIGRNA